MKAFYLLTMALIICMGSGGIAFAGDGTFDSGAFDFCVSVRFNATSAQLQQIETAFQNASQVLADATDGQHRFGTVRIANNSGASQSAEYWVHSGSGRAYATLGRYGTRGEHVTLFFDSDFQQNGGANGDAYTIAHEHAHHAYGVADEYSGPNGAGDCAAPPDTATLNFSLMDNYFTRGGNAGSGSVYTLNEFCVASNHDPDQDTWQDHIHGESCWETIASHPRYAATAPAGLPMDASPTPHTITTERCIGGLRLMLLLDRSGSMGLEERMVFAKSGSKLFVDLLNNDDEIGVASFASGAGINYSLTTITDDSIKTTAKTAIDSLNASGSTNIGGGLSEALSQIVSQADCSCDELIVLLSDGDHNTGTAPSSVIPLLQNESVTVLTVGVGSGISSAGQATLQNIASQTGGKYYTVANASDLTGLFSLLVAESSGSGVLARSPLSISTGETLEYSILLESGIERISFVLSKANAADQVELSLRTPSGVVIGPQDAVGNPDIQFYNYPNSRTFTIRSPEEGTWRMLMSAGTITTGDMEIVAFAENEGVQLNVSVEKDTLVFPETANMKATVLYNGERVVGADVQGSAIRPDGSVLPVTFHDNGQNGDSIPNDGIYAAVFNRFNGDGTYQFEVKAENINGKTFEGELLFPSAPSNQKNVPPFTRVGTTTAVITGVPDYQVATVEYGPETLNLKSNGKFYTAYIELPGLSSEKIDLDTVAITAIDGVSILPIKALKKPSAIGDFDNDGINDLMVKFMRKSLKQVLTPGTHDIQLEGQANGELFIGSRSVGVIAPGKMK